MWEDGAPKNKLFEEWFIARLDNGEKVVLKRLPAEFSYEFRTADDTYYSEFRVAKWMPFPESEFFSPTALALFEALEAAKAKIKSSQISHYNATPILVNEALEIIDEAIALARGNS